MRWFLRDGGADAEGGGADGADCLRKHGESIGACRARRAESLGTRKRGLRPAPTKHHPFRQSLGRVDGIAEGVVNEPELRGFHISV